MKMKAFREVMAAFDDLEDDTEVKIKTRSNAIFVATGLTYDHFEGGNDILWIHGGVSR